ncbi:MAG: hypothetical protein IPH12_02700 [Saprospirales bacterium]|nr:hypothetical protein [Saprospirales bacterium]
MPFCISIGFEMVMVDVVDGRAGGSVFAGSSASGGSTGCAGAENQVFGFSQTQGAGKPAFGGPDPCSFDAMMKEG